MPQDDETGVWYQHRGRDFKVPLEASTHEGSNSVVDRSGFDIWAGCIHCPMMYFSYSECSFENFNFPR